MVFFPKTKLKLQIVSSFLTAFVVLHFAIQVYVAVTSHKRLVGISYVVCVILLLTLTLPILALTVYWQVTLRQNQIGIVQTGKNVIAKCLGHLIFCLVPSTLLVIGNEDNWKGYPFVVAMTYKWLEILMLIYNCLEIVFYLVLFFMILFGKQYPIRSPFAASPGWQEMQHLIQRQPLIIHQSGETQVKELLQANYDADKLHFTAAAA